MDVVELASVRAWFVCFVEGRSHFLIYEDPSDRDSV